MQNPARWKPGKWLIEVLQIEKTSPGRWSLHVDSAKPLSEVLSDEKLLQKVADYLTEEFISDSKDLPKDECHSEAKKIFDLIKEAV
jgi:hypothetical protein